MPGGVPELADGRGLGPRAERRGGSSPPFPTRGVNRQNSYCLSLFTVWLRQKGVVRLREGSLAVDYVFVTRHITDVIPNPWMAYEVCAEIIGSLIAKHGIKMVTNNLVFILEEIRKHMEKEKDRLAEQVFRMLIKSGQMRFLIIKNDQGYHLPSRRKVKKTSNCDITIR